MSNGVTRQYARHSDRFVLRLHPPGDLSYTNGTVSAHGTVKETGQYISIGTRNSSLSLIQTSVFRPPFVVSLLSRFRFLRVNFVDENMGRLPLPLSASLGRRSVPATSPAPESSLKVSARDIVPLLDSLEDTEIHHLERYVSLSCRFARRVAGALPSGTTCWPASFAFTVSAKNGGKRARKRSDLSLDSAKRK